MRAYVKVSISILIIFSSIALGYLFFSGEAFRLSQIEIYPQDPAQTQFQFNKIKQTLDLRLAHLAGRNIWTINIDGILNSIKADQRVKEVSVYRKLPNTIKVKITPYSAIANILGNESNYVYPVARDGEVMPKIPTIEATDSPILRGEIFIKNPQLRKDALNLLLSLPAKGPLSVRSVSELEFKNKSGFSLTLNPNGTEVWFGFDDFARRSSHASRVLGYLTEKEMRGRVIDARYAKKVVVKLRNEP